jgi:hypothetical protein
MRLVEVVVTSRVSRGGRLGVGGVPEPSPRRVDEMRPLQPKAD